jgi:hypothetical protein
MLIVGGSFVAGSDNPHDGTSMPLGASTPSVGLGIFSRLILLLAFAAPLMAAKMGWIGLQR